MLGNKFYYNIIRKITVAFGTLFNDIEIDRVDDLGNVIQSLQVPLLYLQKEKFVQRINSISSVDNEVTVKDVLPMMGFELIGISYAPERKTNTIEKIVDKNTKTRYMFNRVPYNINFALYIGTRKLDDSLRIIEQIVPYFTPEFNVSIKDTDFGFVTNVPYILDSVDPQIEAEGTFDERRSIMWSLQFTAKAFFYSHVNDASVIKKSIIEISNLDSMQFMEGYIAEVNPKTATPTDEYEIIEIIQDFEYDKYLTDAIAGSNVSAELTE